MAARIATMEVDSECDWASIDDAARANMETIIATLESTTSLKAVPLSTLTGIQTDAILASADVLARRFASNV